MDKKFASCAIKELNEKGEGIAVIATLSVIDKDHDVTEPAAFGEQVVPVVPAHDWTEAPLGKARVYESGDQCLADFKLNLKTSLGRDWYEAMRFDFENPPVKQEWSYGYSVLDSVLGEFEGQRVRFLKKVKVHEISPVIVGAGVGTATLALKQADDPDPPPTDPEGARPPPPPNKDLGLKMAEQLARALEYMENTVSRLEEIKAIRRDEGRKLSANRAEEVVRLKALLERVNRMLGEVEGMKTTEDVVAGYFDLKRRVVGAKKFDSAGQAQPS